MCNSRKVEKSVRFRHGAHVEVCTTCDVYYVFRVRYNVVMKIIQQCVVSIWLTVISVGGIIGFILTEHLITLGAAFLLMILLAIFIVGTCFSWFVEYDKHYTKTLPPHRQYQLQRENELTSDLTMRQTILDLQDRVSELEQQVYDGTKK